MEKMLRDAITTLKLDIVCLDPFVKTHAMNENDNNAIDFVCGLLAEIGIDLDCAMDVPHHTNKGLAAAGDANKGRGATSAKDAARLVYTLTPMTPDEAEMFGLDEAERRSLVRYDSAKVNIAPAIHRGEMVPHHRHAAREFHRHLPGRRQRPERRAMDPAGYLGRLSTIPCSTASSMTSTPACPTVSAIPTSALPENGPPGPSSRSTAPTRTKTVPRCHPGLDQKRHPGQGELRRPGRAQGPRRGPRQRHQAAVSAVPPMIGLPLAFHWHFRAPPMMSSAYP